MREAIACHLEGLREYGDRDPAADDRGRGVRSRGVARPARVAGAAGRPDSLADHGVLRHHPDLLRQRRAPSRARLHDDRRRRPGPAHAPARGGRVLPDRDRRARGAGGERRGGRGGLAAGARRPQRREVQGAACRSLDASNDFFIRTSDPEHEPKVQEVLQRVHDNGHVYKGLYEGWYCPRCADFKSDSEIGPDNTCPIHEIPLTREKEENYFFALSKFQQHARGAARHRLRPAARRARTRRGRSSPRASTDVSLTRGKITWGVRVPWDEGHVFYVWFDALLNYYTALELRAARRGPDEPVLGRADDAPHRQGHPQVPHDLLARAADGGRDRRARAASSSTASCSATTAARCPSRDGNVLDPFEVIDRFGTDALRYYLMRDVASARTAASRWRASSRRYETELANDLGNLASRTIAMVRALPRRPRAGAARRRRPGRGPRRRGGDGDGRVAHHRRARSDLAARAPAQRVRRGAGPVEAREGRGQGRRTSTARSPRSSTACGASPSCSSPSCPRRWAA